MTSLQREENESALAQTYAAYQDTRKLMLVLGILATLLATMVAVLVGRHLLKQTRQLETERLKYQTLFETNSDAVVILNDKSFTDCNPATLALFGMNSVEEFLRMPIQQLGTTMQAHGATAKDHAMRYIALARKQGHAVMDWQGRRQDGSVFSAEIALHAMQLEGQPVIQAIMRDVSERRAAEAAKPMHGILGVSSLLLKTPLNGQQREYTATLKSSAESLLTIINDILDFSKIEAGKLEIEQIAFSPVVLAQGVVALFQARALEKNLHLKLILPKDTPTALLGDPTRIRQILLNLVDNAIKFTHHGEIELAVRFDAEGDAVRSQFSVRDHGIGMSSETQERLFQAFSQADSSTTRRFGGTGLGLAVSSQLAGLMAGELSVDSTPEQGSCFTLTLTLPATSLPLVELPTPTLIKLQGRILVAEDHPVNQKVLAHQLDEMGLQHVIAASGTQVLERLANEAFDLVLMDWQMPEMDGLEATRRIRQLPGDNRLLPIVALTANANENFRDACLAAGANDYLAKPYTEAALGALLAQWLPKAGASATAAAAQPAPQLDLSALHARYPGNPVLVNDLSNLFISTTETSLATLKRALEQGDVETCCKEAHALKGAAASVTAYAVQNAAARIENCLRDGDLACAATELGELEQHFRARA
ncbi:MAG: histidine kinase [Hydrogenophilales bacterium 28-61-11]|nr:MAG: histidine kinase [Hydrogenophilales bacterium 28-61-11]